MTGVYAYFKCTSLLFIVSLAFWSNCSTSAFFRLVSSLPTAHVPPLPPHFIHPFIHLSIHTSLLLPPHLSLSACLRHPFTPVSLSPPSLDLSELAKAAKKKLQAVSNPRRGPKFVRVLASRNSRDRKIAVDFISKWQSVACFFMWYYAKPRP